MIEMAKYFLLIFFVLTTPAVSAQVTVNVQWLDIGSGKSKDTIYYDAARKLEWADFKGRPDAASFAGAITESGFGYRMGMQSYNSRVSISITVFCYFNKEKSWVKKGMKTAYALEHEQHHFDITYINTCQFIQKLKAAKLTRANFASAVEKIYDECFAALNQMQDEYDGETSNGRKDGIQLVWNKKISEKLAALSTN